MSDLKFSCATCGELHSIYVGDGFSEDYEWKCRAKNDRYIGYDETFDHIEEVPLWCPKITSLKKRLGTESKKAGNRKTKIKKRSTRYDIIKAI